MKNPFRAWPFRVVGKLRYAAEAFWKPVMKKTLAVKPAIASEIIANGAIEYRSGALEQSRCHLPAQSQYRNAEFRKNRFGEVGATQSLIVIECIDGEFVSTTVGPYAPVRKSPRFAAIAALIIALAALTGKHAYDGMASNSISSKKIASIEKLKSAPAVPSVADKMPGAHEVSRPLAQSGAVETTDVVKNHIPSQATTLGEIESRQTVIEENLITEPATVDKQKSTMEISGSTQDGFSQHITATNVAVRTPLTDFASTNSQPLGASEREPLGNPNPAAGGGDKIENTVNVVKHKTAAQSKRPRESSGTTVIGRVFSGFAKQFSTDLRRLPRQISSIFEK
ncbi:hypothetical protein [Methylocystis sp. B8]|uniref:hypothetical protein n=1 Tax=Methylocystis sp. B8 TaxID=544938 RepID=UPI0010FDEB5C|nr:hypothetical protein [Methylocystis sp. B8]TLG77809.1 hypothetical protein FEV16_08290 [Methylocystis sp. B8]